MIFNSLDFALFLPIVFVLYWFITNKSLKLQNLLILVASYVFYGWWDWRFLFLIFFSTVVDYTIGLLLSKENNNSKRKVLLWISICVNLGFLGFFKYYNFFVDNFVEAFSFFGVSFHPKTLNIILPVGISFYTFQTMSYTIDVYKRKLAPTADFIAFGAFVSFFPQLVAGPIERATNLLPQFYTKRTFDYAKAVDGMRQMLWGLFKKMVVADNCAICVDHIFANYTSLPSSTLLIGAIFFTIQIYSDFSGYSDIAIGCSRLFGFNLMRNFAFPFFSRNMGELWRKWHISLNTWFRDYLYIPLGGSKKGKWITIRNTFIIFLTSGFWHGANWTFIIWGGVNALYFIPGALQKTNRKYMNVIAENRFFPSFKECIEMTTVFLLFTFSFIFFRANSVTEAAAYIQRIVSINLFSFPQEAFHSGSVIIGLIPILFGMEWAQRSRQHGLEFSKVKKRGFRWSIYISLIWFIFNFGGAEAPFIYFQF